MKVTPVKKMSKKKQKAYHARQRGSWNGVSPVTRVAPDRKKYDRNREKRASRSRMDEEAALFLTPVRFFPGSASRSRSGWE